VRYGFLFEVGADNKCNQPGHYLAIRLAIQWGVFDALGDVGEPGKTSTQLAESAGADPRLVGKFDKHRTSISCIHCLSDFDLHY